MPVTSHKYLYEELKWHKGGVWRAYVVPIRPTIGSGERHELPLQGLDGALAQNEFNAF